MPFPLQDEFNYIPANNGYSVFLAIVNNLSTHWVLNYLRKV